MSTVRLKHVDVFKDRHGRARYYFRRGKGTRVVLPGPPGSEEFMRAYQAALSGEEIVQPKALRGDPGTFDRLLTDYWQSANFLRLSLGTQADYRRVIERFVASEKIGHRLVAQMTRQHVLEIVGRRAATPASANHVLKKLRILLRFAIDNGWRRDDPTVRILKFNEGEYHTWTDEEIQQFEAHFPLGTRERKAFALLLYTGQRSSDVKAMDWSNVVENSIHVVQSKTGEKLWIPLHPQLGAALGEGRAARGSLLATSFGKVFTDRGFGNYMSAQIRAAGLPTRCVTHGLRKAAARRLAEAGCSSKEIAAITGHRTLSEIERYTRGAEQRKLAERAMRRLKKEFPNRSEGLGRMPVKPNISKDLEKGFKPCRGTHVSNIRKCGSTLLPDRLSLRFDRSSQTAGGGARPQPRYKYEGIAVSRPMTQRTPAIHYAIAGDRS